MDGSETPTAERLDYLETLIGYILCGKPVRDLAEAIGAVRQQIEEQQLTIAGLQSVINRAKQEGKL